MAAGVVTCPACKADIPVLVRAIDAEEQAAAGKARMRGMTPEQRQALARLANQARWAKRTGAPTGPLVPTIEDVAAATGHALGCACGVCAAAREVRA